MNHFSRLYSIAAISVAAIISITACARTPEERAERLHRKIITIDSHTDTALAMNRKKKPEDSLQVNFEKMYKGGLDVVFFAIYRGQKAINAASPDSVAPWTFRQMARFQRKLNANYSIIETAYSVADIRRIKSSGKKAAVLAVENGGQLGGDIENLDRLYRKGVRCITLCHNNHNDICDSSVSKDSEKYGFQKEPRWHGLSPFGKMVVEGMNLLGMIVDVSHASDETVSACVEFSKAPVIASHSCCRALSDSPRNLPDSLIVKIAQRGGLVQITTYSRFLDAANPEGADVKTFCDHVDHVRNLVGVEHVGFGSDFDGGGGVEGINSALDVRNVTAELIRRGWSDEELELFWGGNLLRVWEQVELVSNIM